MILLLKTQNYAKNEILLKIEQLQPEFLVASVSLSPKIGDDFYEK